jgi:hypothetical protein
MPVFPANVDCGWLYLFAGVIKYLSKMDLSSQVIESGRKGADI